MARWVVFITPLRFMRRRVIYLFAMVGEVEQEAVWIGGFVVVNQAGNDVVVIHISAVVIVIGFQLIVAQACRNVVDIVVEFPLTIRIAEFVLNMRTQQMNNDEFFRRRIGQYLFKRRQHVAVVFTRTLGALLVHIELLIRLFGEHGQHSVTRGHGLLISDPEGLITRLFHHVHQRRLRQI